MKFMNLKINICNLEIIYHKVLRSKIICAKLGSPINIFLKMCDQKIISPNLKGPKRNLFLVLDQIPKPTNR